MKKGHTAMPRRLIVLSASILLLGSLAWCADDQSDVDKRLDASAKVLNEIMGVPDKAIPDKIMHEAKCIAVIPSMKNRGRFRRQPRQGRRDLPHRERGLERSRTHHNTREAGAYSLAAKPLTWS